MYRVETKKDSSLANSYHFYYVSFVFVETFVETKCIDARTLSLEVYDTSMSSLSCELPCDNDEILDAHYDAIERCRRRFMEETAGLPTLTTERHLQLQKVRTYLSMSGGDPG